MRFIASLLGGVLGAALLLAVPKMVDHRWIDHPITSIEHAVGYPQAEVAPAYSYRDTAPVMRRELAPAYRPAQTKLGPIY